MVYVALLRGINVGGKNIVAMNRLKEVFEQTGMEDVTTYINSGNVIFKDSSLTAADIMKRLEVAIEKTFGFHINVLVRDIDNLRAVVSALRSHWRNDASSKCDVMFLWESVHDDSILSTLVIKPEIDEVKYVAGTILWRVEKRNVTRSGLMRIAGSDLYKQMTIRNCNTTRKLLQLMETIA